MKTRTSARKGSTAAAQTIALAVDRAREFSRARRHSYLVRLVKLVLPLIAIASVGVYGAALFASNKLKVKGIEHGKITIDPKNLTMETPKHDGFSKDGTHYIVRAREAITDLKQTGPVRLNVIDAAITQTTGVVTNLKAKWGTYEQKKDILELYEKIDVDGSTGMKARLTRATVFPKESRIVSNEPVYVENETGNIRARQMVFNSKERKGTFTEQVHVKLNAPPPKPDAPDVQKAKAQTPLPGFAANSGQPIEIRSERLDFDDGTKTALFREQVIARQGDAILEAPELDVFYEGKAAIDGSAKPQAKPEAAQAPDAEPSQTRLKTIKARGGVSMTNKEDRANAATLDYDAANETAHLKGNVVMTSGAERNAASNEARFDQKHDTALLAGNVVVQQGKNVLKGQRLQVDRKAGTTRLESPGGGRINALFYQSDGKAPPSQAKAKESVQSVAAAATPFQFKADPSQPIDIDADTMDVFDQKRQAVFKGGVVAKQGAFVVQTAQLTAHYTGQAGIASGSALGATTKGKAGDGTQAAQLTKVEARQKVIVTGTDGQRAVGEWADFDVKANTVTLGGNVVVSQGPEGKRNVLTGGHGDVFIIDMTTGISRLVRPETPAVARTVPTVSGAQATTSGADASQSAAPKRMQMLIHPEERAKSVEAAKQQVQKKPKTGASSWDATTAPPLAEKR